MSSRLGGLCALLLLLAGCSSPEAVRPALWQIDGTNGERGWLFGTIHALPAPVNIHGPVFDQAFAQSNRLVMEVAAIDDDKVTAQTFARLARTPGQPPLEQRVPAQLRSGLATLLKDHGLTAAGFAELETWAAALTLNQALQAELGSDSGNGIDRALLQQRGGKPVSELEGAAGQLAIFDRLSEADQRDLLAEVVRSAGESAAELRSLEAAWKRGDMPALAAMTNQGLLADPELREALLTGRNRDWTGQLSAMLAGGNRPFVAVGAMHLAGDSGLPALLAARGYKVTRLQ